MLNKGAKIKVLALSALVSSNSVKHQEVKPTQIKASLRTSIILRNKKGS